MALAHELSAALEQGAQQGTWVSAKLALAPLDPLQRIFAVRRMRRLLERARRETTTDDPAHTLRVAALLAVNAAPDVSLDDTAAVEAALAALGPRAIPKRPPWWSIATFFVIASACVSVVALRHFLAPFDARETGAGRVLGEGLPAFVSALRGALPSVLADARSKVTGPPAAKVFGGDGVARLGRLLDAAERLARAPRDSDARVERDGFLAAAEGVGRLLKDEKQPYFVDADAASGSAGWYPILMSSYIEREVELAIGGRAVRALHLWRLDRLGVRMGALGYTRPRTPAALVLLDLFLAIASHPPANIRSGAAAAYAKSFGIPLPTVSKRTVHDNQTWRH